MYITMPVTEFNKNNLELLEKKPNIIMAGFFTKLNYHNPYLSFTSLYIDFPISITRIERNLVFFKTQPNDCIQSFIQLEKDILDSYSEYHSRRFSREAEPHSFTPPLSGDPSRSQLQADPHSFSLSSPPFTYAFASSLRRKIVTGVMPFNNSPFIAKEGIHTFPKIIMKISGVWELNGNIGLVYKLFVVSGGENPRVC